MREQRDNEDVVSADQLYDLAVLTYNIFKRRNNDKN